VELEKLSKHLVKHNVPWIPTPRSIQTLIVASLHREYQAFDPQQDSWMSRALQFRNLIPTLAGGVVAVSFFVMAGNSSDQSLYLADHSATNDLIHQSFDTFGLFRSGQFLPATVSSVPESVSGFFRRTALPFVVEVPQIAGSNWFGGAASQVDGIQQAHLLFKIGNEWLYVREISGIDALTGIQCSLPPAAKAALAQSGWYTDPTHPQCSVVVWKKGEVVCVAVSTMGKAELLALLNPSSLPRVQF
jgi:hypothetical protein